MRTELNRMNVRGLEYDRLRSVLYLAVRAAHNARERDRLVLVGDDEHVRAQRVVNIVERAEILALTCVSYDNGTAVEACIIKCVHRLSVLKHYIVRNIYNIIYGTNAGCTETHTHPERRGRDVHVLYNAVRSNAGKARCSSPRPRDNSICCRSCPLRGGQTCDMLAVLP